MELTSRTSKSQQMSRTALLKRHQQVHNCYSASNLLSNFYVVLWKDSMWSAHQLLQVRDACRSFMHATCWILTFQASQSSLARCQCIECGFCLRQPTFQVFCVFCDISWLLCVSASLNEFWSFVGGLRLDDMLPALLLWKLAVSGVLKFHWLIALVLSKGESNIGSLLMKGFGNFGVLKVFASNINWYWRFGVCITMLSGCGNNMFELCDKLMDYDEWLIWVDVGNVWLSNDDGELLNTDAFVDKERPMVFV